jgi:hypothetical protein
LFRVSGEYDVVCDFHVTVLAIATPAPAPAAPATAATPAAPTAQLFIADNAAAAACYRCGKHPYG